MFAEIYAVDDDAYDSSDGHALRITASVLDIKARKQDYNERQWLEITASSHEGGGVGPRGGKVKKMNRKFTLRLYVRDLKQILEQAIKAGLVAVPGQQEVDKAADLLAKALASMASSVKEP